MPNLNHKMYKSGGVTVVEDLEENELRIYEDNDGYLHVRLDSDMAKFILGRLTYIDSLYKRVVQNNIDMGYQRDAEKTPDASADSI